MNRIVQTGAAALAIAALTSQAMATGICRRDAETAALKAETLQQELMVAALVCNAARPYNSFVLSYRPDLQASDQAAQGFFQRVNATGGFSAYQTFKTQLANDFSIDSMRDTDGFCANAQGVFTAISDERGAPLSDVIASLSMSGDEPYAACDVQSAATEDDVAGGSSGGSHARR